MDTMIMLQLVGLDLRDPATFERIPEDLADVGFSANGPISYTTMYALDGESRVAAAADLARRVAKHMPGVRVTNVYDELVTTADIARRCGVSAEAVRLWISGGRRQTAHAFPAARQNVGASAKSMMLWAWRDVVSWIREVIPSLDPDLDVEYLDDREIAELNHEIATLDASNDLPTAWQALRLEDNHIVTHHQQTAIVGTALMVAAEKLDQSHYEAHIHTRSSYALAARR